MSEIISKMMDWGEMTDDELSECAQTMNPKDAVIDLMNAVEEHVILRTEGGWETVWHHADRKSRICPMCGKSLFLVKTEGMEEYSGCADWVKWVLRCPIKCTFKVDSDPLSLLKTYDGMDLTTRIVSMICGNGYNAKIINMEFSDEELISIIKCLLTENNAGIKALNAVCVLLMKHGRISQDVMDAYNQCYSENVDVVR